MLDTLPEQTGESESLRTRAIDRAAREAAKNSSYAEAIALMERIPDYRDARNLIRSWKYTLAESLIKAEKWEEVLPLLEELGNYKNASRWLKQAQEALNPPTEEDEDHGS